MNTPAGGGKPEVEGRTAQPTRAGDTRYFYYMDRSCQPPLAVFVCDHAYDCESLYRESNEEEVLAMIGEEALRAAQDDCAWNALGSKRLLVYP